MKTPTTYATKSNLLDYVTKGEFNEFKEEMYDFKDEMYHFRDEMGTFQTATEKRFNNIDRKLVDMDENIRRSIGLMHEQFREDLKTSMEYFSDMDRKKVDKDEFDALRLKINIRFFEGKTVV